MLSTALRRFCPDRGAVPFAFADWATALESCWFLHMAVAARVETATQAMEKNVDGLSKECWAAIPAMLAGPGGPHAQYVWQL